MDEHLIFFIDILGFQEAVRTWEEEKIAMLTGLLRAFATWRSESAYTQTPGQEGSSKIFITPAVTTFSDHMVLSYPTEHLRKVWGGGLNFGLLQAQERIGTLAGAAASLGLLIRGGVTVGPLYHADGVVFGQAMNEAYYLESRVSIYPRLAVSRKVYSQVAGREHLLLDDDGITHFDYFKDMILGSGNPPGSEYGQRLRTWFTETQRVIAENIDRFERAEQWNELSKWVWFKNRFDQARAGLPDVFFQE